MTQKTLANVFSTKGGIIYVRVIKIGPMVCRKIPKKCAGR